MGAEGVADESGFDMLFYGNPQPMWIYDIHSLQMLEVNTSATKRYGYTREEFLTLTVRDLRPTLDIHLLEDLLSAVKGYETHTREFRHLSKNGQILFADITGYSIVYKGMQACMVYARSIDERRELAGKLHLTQRKLMQILETTVIGFLQLDFNWNITYWNKAAEGLIGYSSNDVMGRNIWEVLPEIYHSDFHLYLQRAMTTRANIDFTDYFWPTQNWFACNAYPAEDGIIVHFRDITHNKKAEEDLLKKVQRLKEVSFLNSHALRKPIASLLGLSKLVKEELIAPEEFKEVAIYIHNCSVELDEVVKEINNKASEEELVHSLKLSIENFSFKELLKTVIDEAQTYSAIHNVLAGNLGDIAFYGNRHSIEKAVKYLIKNAIRFSFNAGKIIVNSEVINQNVVLSVHDFGIGITGENLKNIFVDLSSKEASTAILIGLQHLSAVCQQHHGSMWIESEVGKGTTFMMRFPLSNIATLKATGRPDFSVYQNGRTEIKYHPEDNYIEVNWKGFHNLYSIKDNCYKILHFMKETCCAAILNSNLDVLGSWDDAMDWVAKEWFPLMDDAGLQYFAWIYSPSTFSKFSTSHTVALIETRICLKEFDDKDEALRWLLEVNSNLNCC
ncbi:PAS domain S-box protein [Mucilaginibacter terrae]|uniref:PAS domain S-box protein n=1 Tax=Mucilaginibacter terrae TaxID=1955052 RepID=UPI003626A401